MGSMQSFLVLPLCPFHPSSSLPSFCDIAHAWRYLRQVYLSTNYRIPFLQSLLFNNSASIKTMYCLYKCVYACVPTYMVSHPKRSYTHLHSMVLN
jgi:hypothetical protein